MIGQSARSQEILIRNNELQLPRPSGNPQATRVEIATILTNLTYYGYALSPEAFQHLTQASLQDLSSWWKQVDKALKKVTGDDKKMDDFVVYKNFPRQVLDMGQGEYWFNQILMYWGFPNEYFTGTEEPRDDLKEQPPCKVLRSATTNSILNIYSSLLAMPIRWIEEQWRDVEYLSKIFVSLEKPHTIDLSECAFKENMAQLGVFFLAQDYLVTMTSAMDVLRLAVGISGGDVSMREKSKFRTFKRKERRYLLGLLETSTNLEEDLCRNPNKWKKLFFGLKPRDYASRFPKVVDAYQKLYAGTLPRTFNAIVEKYLLEGDEEVLILLKSRPGEFVRRLHTCLLKFGQPAVVQFLDCIHNLTTLQLLKLQKYLETINNRKFRTFAPQGNWTKLQVVPNTGRDLPGELKFRLSEAIGSEITRRLEKHYPAVNLSDNAENVKLQTNDNDLAPYGRGTSFPIPPEMKFIRSATYWESGGTAHNVWYDNGWNFFGDGWNPIGTCCWNQNRFGTDAAIFSGDPTNSKEKCGRACQMIDLYLDKLEQVGVRYALWNVLCYNQVSFNKAEEVFAALQWGIDPQQGKLFEPSRCQMSFPLTGDNLTKYVAYIDLKTRELVYIDANLYGQVHSASCNLSLMAEKMPVFVEYLETLPSVWDLFSHLEFDPDEGLPVMYTDEGVDLEDGSSAWVFNPTNPNNDFEGVNYNSLLGEKGEKNK